MSTKETQGEKLYQVACPCGGLFQHVPGCPKLAASPRPVAPGVSATKSKVQEAVDVLREHAKLGCSPALGKLAEDLEKEVAAPSSEDVARWRASIERDMRYGWGQPVEGLAALDQLCARVAALAVEVRRWKEAEEQRIRLGEQGEAPKPTTGRPRVYREDPPRPLTGEDAPEPVGPPPSEKPESEVKATWCQENGHRWDTADGELPHAGWARCRVPGCHTEARRVASTVLSDTASPLCD